ncbi:MAG: GAF domain-containing protein [Defluviitaleaceae bacterium]|nr:GAF domain-containing protein [Defluviitaleaceae bacterium]
MFEQVVSADERKRYSAMLATAADMLADEADVTANLANIGALVNMYMDRINWVGFYIMRDGVLVLGPFQGKPACVRIKPGFGVCGTAAAQRRVLVVEDVHRFEGHIACDSASNSEIVLPIYRQGEVYGVLDVDSPELARFGKLEEEVLGELASKISAFLG